MKPYAQYKNSGAEWIGQVPAHWKVERIGNWFVVRADKVDSVSFPPLSVSKQGVVDRLAKVAKSQDIHNRKLVKKNDFVINSRSDRKGSAGIAPRDGSVSLINTVLKPAEVNLRWVEHILKSHYFKEEFFRNGQGIHWDLWTTPWDQMKTIVIPIPSVIEQKFIAQYLDKKVEQINALVAKVETKIELLKEQRTSLITECVTKGLDSTVEMKNSGVEWIGQIPNHWEVERIGNWFVARNDKVDSVSFPPLSVSKQGVVDQLEEVAKSQDLHNRKLVKKNDFVINSRSDRKGSSGIAPRDGSVSLINTVLQPAEVNLHWVEHLLKSHYFKEEFFRNGKGIHGDLWTTHWDQMKTILIPIPSASEQKQIASHLDNRTQQIDTLIAAETRRIALLTEHKESLVSSVVTGKIRVTEKML